MSALGAGHAEQPTLRVDSVFERGPDVGDRGSPGSLGSCHVEKHARVEVTAARCHDETARRRQTHRRVSWCSVENSRHARATPGVREQDVTTASRGHGLEQVVYERPWVRSGARRHPTTVRRSGTVGDFLQAPVKRGVEQATCAGRGSGRVPTRGPRARAPGEEE